MSRRTGVVLGQIGTPATLDISEIRRYLSEFLSDRRVIDLPRWQWWPILHGIILRRRPAKVREHYREIWTDAGSPLLVISQAQRAGIAERLGPDFQVELGLAYSAPGLGDALARLEQDAVEQIVVMPMFPQFSTTTIASIYDAVLLHALGREAGRGRPRKKYSPAVRCVPPIYRDPGYISVLADSVRRQLAEGPEPDHVLVSYHGIPRRYVDEGDPYLGHCHETTRLLARALGWDDGYYETAFQSRFGKAEWIKPYLQPRLGELHAAGIQRPAIVAPGFTTDCLETLHELDIEGRELFEAGGGDPSGFRFLRCLNDEPAWLDFLAGQIRAAAHPQPDPQPEPAETASQAPVVG